MTSPVRIISIASLLTLIVCFPNALRADDKWSWNPFSKAATTRESNPIYSGASASTESKKSSWLPNWKTPRMPWDSSGPRVSSYSKSNTSSLDKMSRTSKKWWKNTTDFLDPYPDPKPSKYANNYDKPKKANWFTGMFKKNETKKIETLPDWLRQESPKF
jgi:hypothetical protein